MAPLIFKTKHSKKHFVYVRLRLLYFSRATVSKRIQGLYALVLSDHSPHSPYCIYHSPLSQFPRNVSIYSYLCSPHSKITVTPAERFRSPHCEDIS